MCGPTMHSGLDHFFNENIAYNYILNFFHFCFSASFLYLLPLYLKKKMQERL